MAATNLAAINAALAQNWESAIEINKEVLKKNKEDLDCLSRLAFAYTQSGDLEKAKKIYKKILSLDKYNNLALKNLNKITTSTGSKKSSFIHERVNPGLFIEEPGKTKVVTLKNIAPLKIIYQLNIGDTVVISPKKHGVEIRGLDKTYYGALPDDIAFRLLKFISAGNTYIACIKNIQKNLVSVFIRELSRGKKLELQPTFSPSSLKDYNASFQKEFKKTVLSDENEEESAQEESEE